MYHVPATEEIRKQSGVPFGLVISPLARIQEGESEHSVQILRNILQGNVLQFSKVVRDVF